VVGLRGRTLYRNAGLPVREAAVEDVYRVVFAMRVAERLSFAEYWRDPRFLAKRPTWRSGPTVSRAGDNAYEPLAGGGYRQLPSMHSRKDDGGSPDEERKAHDLGGEWVLASPQGEFWYFGREPVEEPPALARTVFGGSLRSFRGHRVERDPAMINEVVAYLSTRPAGVLAPPHRWPPGDQSWRA